MVLASVDYPGDSPNPVGPEQVRAAEESWRDSARVRTFDEVGTAGGTRVGAVLDGEGVLHAFAHAQGTGTLWAASSGDWGAWSTFRDLGEKLGTGTSASPVGARLADGRAGVVFRGRGNDLRITVTDGQGGWLPSALLGTDVRYDPVAYHEPDGRLGVLARCGDDQTWMVSVEDHSAPEGFSAFESTGLRWLTHVAVVRDGGRLLLFGRGNDATLTLTTRTGSVPWSEGDMADLGPAGDWRPAPAIDPRGRVHLFLNEDDNLTVRTVWPDGTTSEPVVFPDAVREAPVVVTAADGRLVVLCHDDQANVRLLPQAPDHGWNPAVAPVPVPAAVGPVFQDCTAITDEQGRVVVFYPQVSRTRRVRIAVFGP